MRRGLFGEVGALTARPAQHGTTALRLRNTDVDIWRATLDDVSPDTLAQLATLLSTDEMERARRFYFERDRRRFIVGRGVLRSILGRYLTCAPEEIAFTYGPNGKPTIAGGGAAAELAFNVAHSDGLALYAFTRAGAVGIDLERVRGMPDWECVAASYFSAAEQERLRSVAPELRRDEFFRAWTRQEALIKASGVGLGAIDRLAVPRRPGVFAPEGANPAFRLTGASAYRVYALTPAPCYVGALAIGPTARWATCFSWQHGDANEPAPIPARSRRMPLDQLSEPRARFL